LVILSLFSHIDGQDQPTYSSVCAHSSFVAFYDGSDHCVQKKKVSCSSTYRANELYRDRSIIDYLNNKIRKNDAICVNMLRLTKGPFIHFCDLIRKCGLLQDTVYMCVEQQVAMFLHTIGHNLKNRKLPNSKCNGCH
jgi:hypothetical protein